MTPTNCTGACKRYGDCFCLYPYQGVKMTKEKKVVLIPEPEVKELDPRASWSAMVNDFGLEDPKTMPMPLDELPKPKKNDG